MNGGSVLSAKRNYDFEKLYLAGDLNSCWKKMHHTKISAIFFLFFFFLFLITDIFGVCVVFTEIHSLRHGQSWVKLVKNDLK